MDAASVPAHRLRRQDVKTLVLSALGGALEFYDFVIFVFLAGAIGQLFFPPETAEWLRTLQTFGLFAAGYLARPLGGIVMAHFGDRHGRKRMFTLSVFLMALPTLVIGLLPTYAAIGYAAPLLLLLMRVLQGAAVGGEVPGAWVFVSEHVPARRVGLACGVLTAGLTAGILLGSLIADAVHSIFDADAVLRWAWRIPFLIGGVFGFLAVILRRYLAETPVFRAMRERRELEQGMPLGVVLRRHRLAVIQSMLLTWMLTAAIVVVILMLPALMPKLFDIDTMTALRANTAATLALTIGCVLTGLSTDRFGLRVTLGVGATGLAATTYLLFAGLAANTPHVAALYALTGLFVGMVATVPVALVRSFPPAVRFSGISFAYNVAYALFGGLTPLVISLWLRSERMAPAHYVTALCVLGLAFAIFGLPDKKSDNARISAPEG
ncbi:MFS transporter [Oleiagrimonas soli]|uniref:MFS family permease n=1 Tax=Oleiagrimonas soli TaxID=1543381 RepID=A0A099CXF0_9GAMM|nr:MFS transporter [Oleiagrimonas soli]KGI77695.1 MFS transporter [Oleiagrimonas soli]MBB6183058.1 MFS family permease [Oleiagrimonas soli]